jgi:hypothetical protein
MVPSAAVSRARMAVFIASFNWSRSMSLSRSVEGRKLIARPAVGKANKLLKRLIN